MKLNKKIKCFEGTVEYYKHESKVCNAPMNFAIFRPPGESKFPVLYFLSGLTCTEENFITKAGALSLASELGIFLVIPDTSPRGLGIPGENASYDLGSGAGFYVDATEPKWSRHYNMYSYVVDELPELIKREFPVDSTRESIMGHSMGGHGALVVGLNHPKRFKSISAFSPISNPINSPWGRKAFKEYLGEDLAKWAPYDASHLLSNFDSGLPTPPILVDQGDADEFLAEQLHPMSLKESAPMDFPLTLNMRGGYDHSYLFISSFISEHLRFHSQLLGNN